MAANDAYTKVIASFYRDDLGVVFLTIYVPILYLPTFSGFSPCHDQGFQKRFGYFHRFPTTFRRLPNVAENVRKFSEDV